MQGGTPGPSTTDLRPGAQSWLAAQEAVQLAPQRYELLATCAKAISDAAYLDEIPRSHKHWERLSWADKRALNERAFVYAQQAVEAAGDRALPHVASCVSLGRRALFSGNREKVRGKPCNSARMGAMRWWSGPAVVACAAVPSPPAPGRNCLQQALAW